VKRLLVAALALALSGCAGYRIGNVKPNYLRDVQSVAVPTFKNDTYHPRIEALVTSTIIKQFQQDGTFRIASVDNADAVLEGRVVSIGRQPVRSVRGNVLATTEFNLVITVAYTLKKRGGEPLAGPATIGGVTSFFVGGDVNSEERQALPLATENLAVRLVSQLSEGW
jgi:hypothetical protein